MKDLVNKLVGIEKEISDERGEFALFALFLRRDAPDRWDLVLSAPWFGPDEKDTLDYFARKIKSHLKERELLTLSRIVLVNPSDPAVKAIQTAMEIEHGSAEVINSVFFGLPISHAYVITSKKLPAERRPKEA